jgi:predicted nucleic-acid-binding protein
MVTYAGSLDASVLLRLVLGDMPKEHKAAADLLESSPHPFAIADLAIIELVFVLENHYQFSRTVIKETVEALLALPNIVADQQLFSEALPLFVTYKTLTIEDCYLRSYAQVQDARPLWTFDKKLAKQGKGIQTVQTK